MKDHWKLLLFLMGPIGWFILAVIIIASGSGGSDWKNPPSGD